MDLHDAGRSLSENEIVFGGLRVHYRQATFRKLQYSLRQDNGESEPTLLFMYSSISFAEVANRSLEINTCFDGEVTFNRGPLAGLIDVPEFRAAAGSGASLAMGTMLKVWAVVLQFVICRGCG